MKKILILLSAVTLLLCSCTKDEEPKEDVLTLSSTSWHGTKDFYYLLEFVDDENVCMYNTRDTFTSDHYYYGTYTSSKGKYEIDVIFNLEEWDGKVFCRKYKTASAGTSYINIVYEDSTGEHKLQLKKTN